MEKRIYLGDGVYAETDHHSIKLWTNRQNGEHFLFLEKPELLSLLRFASAHGFIDRNLRSEAEDAEANP